METQNQNPNNNFTNDWENHFKEHQIRHQRGKIFGGILLVAIGGIFLAKEMGVVFPEWLFTWQMFLIVFGFYLGVRHAFRHIGWLIMMLVGSIFMCREFYPQMHYSPFLWPVFIIIMGLFLIFKPRRKYDHDHFRRKWERKMYRHGHHFRGNRFAACASDESSSADDTIRTDAVFSSFDKNILSKDFKGGDVSCVFGGGTLNLYQADINGTAVLEVSAVFGGMKIIVPANWQVQTDVSTVFGGVEDKRPR